MTADALLDRRLWTADVVAPRMSQRKLINRHNLVVAVPGVVRVTTSYEDAPVFIHHIEIDLTKVEHGVRDSSLSIRDVLKKIKSILRKR